MVAVVAEVVFDVNSPPPHDPYYVYILIIRAAIEKLSILYDWIVVYMFFKFLIILENPENKLERNVLFTILICT